MDFNAYEAARAQYAALGVDTDAAMKTLAGVPVSIHCWQGDDVHGFENGGAALSGGIQATGDYPGRARCFEELCADFLKAAEQIPGKKRINLHASYLVSDTPVDRDAIEYEHFAPWVAFAKQHGFGIDFNPTYFSHPMVKDNLTLSSPDEAVRAFWVEHGRRCRRIAGRIAAELGSPVLNNIWIPDGFKDVPADRMAPRLRLKKSLDEIFAEKIEGVVDCVESKVFGIGLESYTVGSAEFYLSYAASHPGVYDLLDNGHYHPTEFVSDKIPAFLCFFDKVPLHVTRPVRWDSDHVVLFDDETRPRDDRPRFLRRLDQPRGGMGRRHAQHGKGAALGAFAAERPYARFAGQSGFYRADGAFRKAQDDAVFGGLGTLLRGAGRAGGRPRVARACDAV